MVWVCYQLHIDCKCQDQCPTAGMCAQACVFEVICVPFLGLSLTPVCRVLGKEIIMVMCVSVLFNQADCTCHQR